MMHIKDHQLQILPFAPAHLDGVERLERLCFAHPWQRADLETQLTNPCVRFLVAVLGDKVVGYLGVQVVCGEGSVTNVAVDPTYRRRGIARALFGACFAAGETVVGIVRSVEDYGVFIEIAPNLAGLAEPDTALHPGQTVSVYIKSILPDKMKIKLVVVNKNLNQKMRFEPHYFVTRGRLDRWIYSCLLYTSDAADE